MFHIPAHKQIPKVFEVFIESDFEFYVCASSPVDAREKALRMLDDVQRAQVEDGAPLEVEPERPELILWRAECRRLAGLL